MAKIAELESKKSTMPSRSSLNPERYKDNAVMI
jgi:hypothetical protein